MASVSENLELVLPTNEDVVNIGDISENFSKIDDTLGVNADNILELSTLIAALQSANQTLTQRINTEILGPLNDLIDDVDAFDSQIQGLTSRMSTAEGTLTSNTSAIAQNTNAIAQLRFDMDDAETAITEHNHDGRYILLTEKGTANGVAELDSGGKVPATQLPSYVDDVLEYASVSAFPATGESGKLYVAIDVNKTYRQTGSTYVSTNEGLALGETSSTAYRGDRGKIAYDHASDNNKSTTAKSLGLYKIASTNQGHVANLTPVTKQDITGLGVADADHNHDSRYLAIKENIGTTYSDYNSYNTTGIYIDNGQSTIQHRPDPDNALPGILEVVTYGDYCHQMFKCFRSYDVFVRYLQADNTWSEWDVLSGGASYPDGNEVSY